jgi:transcriptional regulator with XRE-family HTH domain
MDGGPVPRKERPLESEDTPLLAFAGDLRRLRQRAGLPSYRELGRRTNYSAAALSEALSGRRLPSLAVTGAIVRACHGDVDEWTGRWRRLAAARPDAHNDGPAPYVGLAAYQVDDADRFFGREAVTDTLIRLVTERPFVGVFGASGAGKSSLLRAGLIAGTHRTPILVTPGTDPITELAVAVADRADEPADRVHRDLTDSPESLRGWLAKAADDVLLVVDQFEEVFTLCDESARRWLIRALITAAGPHARVVIGVRADFYGHCAAHPELVTALHRAQVLVGPMSTEELRAAITEPAARAGATIETALVARLVADVAGQPAALPLVSHTLAETWRRRRGLALTLAGYQDVGGIEHALARTAEETFEQLSEADRETARRLFLRLVVPGDGTADTKRRVPRADLPVPGALLDRLAATRLITIDRDCVELTHEALLRAWPRLTGWIAQSRDDLRAQHRLTEATAIWEAHGHDPDTLYRGARLEQAALLRDRLSPRECGFVDAGLAAEHARARADQRVTRRLRRLAAGLAVLVLLVAGAAVVAAVARHRATQQRNDALSLRASDAARDMIAGRPREAAALALAAYRLTPTVEARDVLFLAHAATGATILGGGWMDPPGQRYAVTWGKASGLQLWRRSGGQWRPAGTLPNDDTHLHQSSLDERRAIYRAEYSTSVLWDLTDLDRPRRISVPAELGLLDGMDRTGSMVSGLGADKTARLWRTGERSVRRIPAGEVISTAVLADGSGMVLSRQDGDQDTVEQWSPAGRRVATLLRVPHPSIVQSGPAGLIIVTSYPRAVSMTVMRVGGPGAPRVVAQATGLDETSVPAFDPAGRTVAVVDTAEARIWDTTTGRKIFSLHTQGLRLGSPRLAGTELSVLDGKSALWRIDADLDTVIGQICARPAAVDWDRYFPGAEHRRLCP